MAPITKKEVEEAITAQEPRLGRDFAKQEFAREAIITMNEFREPIEDCGKSWEYWLMVGYEIARRRVEEGRDL